MKQNTLPTYPELVAGGQRNELKKLLYAPVNDQWKRKHPFLKSGGKAIDYIPVSHVETNLDIIFGDHIVEVIDTKVLEDCCSATVRVHVTYPDGTHHWHDGAAIKNFQKEAMTDVEKATLAQLMAAAESTGDLSTRVKILNTYYDLQRAKPIRVESREAALQVAISEAIKDACDHFGPIFGRDLNRKESFDAIPAQAPAQGVGLKPSSSFDLSDQSASELSSETAASKSSPALSSLDESLANL
jgi:hypothetical protein